MKYSRKWEKVANCTDRLRVPTGWLVSVDVTLNESISTALCFVPDANHEWELEELKK